MKVENPRQTGPEQIDVKIGNDDLRSFSLCSPVVALEELIWNAFDADANNVWIETEYSDEAMLKLSSISIKDDGRGFEIPAKEAFGGFGESQKKQRRTTVGGRIQHGRQGKGRYRALALGLGIEWTSRFEEIEHQNLVFKRVSESLHGGSQRGAFFW